LKTLTFWGRNENDERLLVECLLGIKTATCTPKVWCGEDEIGQVGERFEVFTKKGQKACVIEMTEVYETPFGNIKGEMGEKIAKGENSTLEEYIDDHVFSWDEALRNDGYSLNENTIIVVEHFKLVESYIHFSELGHRVKVTF
jgi:uncharacterized protein YhfF